MKKTLKTVIKLVGFVSMIVGATFALVLTRVQENKDQYHQYNANTDYEDIASRYSVGFNDLVEQYNAALKVKNNDPEIESIMAQIQDKYTAQMLTIDLASSICAGLTDYWKSYCLNENDVDWKTNYYWNVFVVKNTDGTFNTRINIFYKYKTTGNYWTHEYFVNNNLSFFSSCFENHNKNSGILKSFTLCNANNTKDDSTESTWNYKYGWCSFSNFVMAITFKCDQWNLVRSAILPDLTTTENN